MAGAHGPEAEFPERFAPTFEVFQGSANEERLKTTGLDNYTTNVQQHLLHRVPSLPPLAKHPP